MVLLMRLEALQAGHDGGGDVARGPGPARNPRLAGKIARKASRSECTDAAAAEISKNKNAARIRSKSAKIISRLKNTETLSRL